MSKTHLAYQPSRLTYPQPPHEPDLSDDRKLQIEEQHQEPQIGPYKPKPTLPKDAPDLPQASPSTPTINRSLGEYLTRRQGAAYVRDVLGRPMSFSTASKLAALGEFAEPAIWWGRRPLYRRDDLRAWAEARSRPTKESAASEGTNLITTRDQTDDELVAQRGPTTGCGRHGRETASPTEAHKRSCDRVGYREEGGG